MVYAAQSAGASLPEGCVIDRDGKPTTDPWTISTDASARSSPAAGQKGYAMALTAELIAEALIGPVKTDANWLLVMIDTKRLTAADTLHSRAEVILNDIRTCPPAPGFDPRGDTRRTRTPVACRSRQGNCNTGGYMDRHIGPSQQPCRRHMRPDM